MASVYLALTMVIILTELFGFSFLIRPGPYNDPLLEAVGMIILVPIIEEFVFRFIPLVVAVTIWGQSHIVLGVAIIASVIFGISHGGIEDIFVQGFTGIILSFVFLKCGGFQNNFSKGLNCSVAVHGGHNAIAFIIAYL